MTLDGYRNELQAALDKATVQLSGEQQALRSLAAQGSLRDALVQSTAARASADATRLVEQLSSQLDARHAESVDLAAKLASAETLIQRLNHRIQVNRMAVPCVIMSASCCRAAKSQTFKNQDLHHINRSLGKAFLNIANLAVSAPQAGIEE